MKPDPPPHIKLGPIKLDSSFVTELLDTADREVRVRVMSRLGIIFLKKKEFLYSKGYLAAI